jgi:signal transduction histidine kinase/CheY-like chemotaxis protein/CHASE3 domain sensor protein
MESNFKRNLLIGYSTSLVILVISSVASYMSITRLLKSAEMVNHTHEVNRGLHDVLINMVNSETTQRGYLVMRTDYFYQTYLNSIGPVDASVEFVREKTRDNPKQQENVQLLEKLIVNRYAYLNQANKLVKEFGDLDQSQFETGKLVMDSIRVLISDMQSMEQDLMNERSAEMSKFSNYTLILIVVAAIFAIAITLSFYFRVQNDFERRNELQNQLEAKDRDITERINIVEDIANKIAKGDFSVRADESQSDALGNVGLSLNKMAESLQKSFKELSDKEWHQSGMAKLNDVMLGDKTIEKLGSDILEFLAHYTDSQVGSFYLLEDNRLVALSGYAFIPELHKPVIQIGDGLLGQAVKEENILTIKNMPSDSMIVSFVTGNIKPTHVMAIPVFDGYAVKGAIELGSVEPYSDSDLEFVKSASHSIGIAINMGQNRKRVQDLLEETQLQAQELKVQHTELENLNSELEVQSEKLQASEEELKVQQEELKQANLELEERSKLLEERNELITIRNSEIQAKANELSLNAKYKSEFLANMSHELRTPLNSILLLSRLLSENQDNNLTADQVEYARVIQGSGNGLLSLIDEILDLSKIEAGKMSLEYQEVNVKEIVLNMKRMLEPLAVEKGIAFRTNIDKDSPDLIETDQLRLEQILKNLLSNALKFTAKGHVSLTVSLYPHDKSYVQFSVEDTGIGIPKEKQQLVFEAFQQADGSTRRKYGGTGLGLSISRELSKLLGGEIMLKSEENEGSTFTVIIPLKKEQGERTLGTFDVDRIQEIEATVPTDKPLFSSKYVSNIIPKNIPDDREDISSSDKTILIVEDDVHFAKSLLDYTHKRGYKGVVAVRGDEGIELAKKIKPVGILLDIQLPVKSGWEVMDALKGDPDTRHIPVHIMSSYEVKNESLTKGAVDFINKPFAFEKIKDVFQKIEGILTDQTKKVLIVEENPKHAKALAYFLESSDVSIEISSSVDEAMKSLKTENVNCVILDMGIPDQKAYDTLEGVKKTTGLENVPIIVFTGKSLSQREEMRIKQYAGSIVVKTAHSYKRILDEVSIFLHLMEKNNKPEESSKFNKLGALDDVLKNKTVLIADDDVRNIFSLTKALEAYNMNVMAAVDGKDALQKIQGNPEIDIVLMDMMMPEMDGYESTTAIRKSPKYQDLPVIAVTAKAMMGDRAKCINAGASDYITKPVDIDQLLSLLRVWLYEKRTK